MSAKYRSKVVEIEAREWGGGAGFDDPGGYEPCVGNRPDGIVDWVSSNGGQAHYEPVGSRLLPEPHIAVETLEGTMAARPGDWIIRGTEGEFYPCKPSVFERKYEPVSGDC